MRVRAAAIVIVLASWSAPARASKGGAFGAALMFLGFVHRAEVAVGAGQLALGDAQFAGAAGGAKLTGAQLGLDRVSVVDVSARLYSGVPPFGVVLEVGGLRGSAPPPAVGVPRVGAPSAIYGGLGIASGWQWGRLELRGSIVAGERRTYVARGGAALTSDAIYVEQRAQLALKLGHFAVGAYGAVDLAAPESWRAGLLVGGDLYRGYRKRDLDEVRRRRHH